MKTLFLFLICTLILTGKGFAKINTITGWDGMSLSILNDDFRQMSSTSGLQKINTMNDLSSSASLSVLNDDLVLISRELSLPEMSTLTAFDDTNLSVLNNDLQYISQNLGS